MGIHNVIWGCVSKHSSDGSTNLLKSINTEPTENDHILYFNLLEPFIHQYNIVGNKISSATQSLNKISSPVNVSNDNAQAILVMDNIKLI